MFQKYFLNHLYSFASSLLHNLLGYGLGFASRRAIKTKKRGHHENNNKPSRWMVRLTMRPTSRNISPKTCFLRSFHHDWPGAPRSNAAPAQLPPSVVTSPNTTQYSQSQHSSQILSIICSLAGCWDIYRLYFFSLLRYINKIRKIY